MYRNLAPISKNAWDQIDARAKEVLISTLTARKAVHVSGPKGSEYVVYNHGRLGEVSESDGVSFASYQVTPLVETRIEFKLNRWALDNAVRGDKNIDFSSLEAAIKKAALFEEQVVYEGLAEGNIKGLLTVPDTSLKLGNTASDIKKSVAEGVIKLRNAYASGNMDLIVSQELYAKLWAMESQTPLVKALEDMISGKVIASEVIKGAILIPHDNENLELVLGDDFTLGYQEHDQKEVTFFIKESFTFQISDESLIVRFEE
ncbi:MAG TPA: bacteriocin family protein [Clostridiales bacterium]|nr:bacteriocin family protein [Clostridiales bacterium]